MVYQETMQALFEPAFAKYQSRVAIKYEGREYTYQHVNQAANRLSHALQRSGVGPGDRVALVMKNCPEFLISDLAIMKAGAGKVPLNDMLGEREMKYMLQDSGAKVVIVAPEFYRRVAKMKAELPALKEIIAITDDEHLPQGFTPWSRFTDGESDENPSPRAIPEDLYILGYTGGTTGNPKGVVHTQRNGYLNLCSHLIETGMTYGERVLLTTPLPHSAGSFALTGLLRGATIVLEKAFNPKRVLEQIETENITFTFMVPTMIYRVLDELKEANFNVSSLRTIIYGAAPITAARLKEGLDQFGPVFLQFFGQSECPNFITKLEKEDHTLEPGYIHRLRSCGRPVTMTDVQVVNENAEPVATGEEGEIICRSPYVMNEYFNLPEKTSETIRDGWLFTGDVGKIDGDGFVYLLDRKKDMIISGGMNIYTTEVEDVIQKHPDVAQTAVIGVPDENWGEMVLAFVIPNGEALKTDELTSFCKQHLSSYKRPKRFELTKEFPLTPYGKIDKKALRKPYWDQQGRSVN
ncbi:long-chain-fatty-acid--CoA ligase [Desertibacillus haloalkaliphilus]|uniref:long-chain-fatty-acid--CoA ligase n=1 Tax=Desertibacillus haloalkaliphilus TaxID=1328930 RepID=UPI001C258267|nr:long-chain-fatty-acid--CoA ligase [Desertibacillus haloalkaliphilus]MBU8908029.1 long-chain-fatty-acid--CoA ligase [Desertibacillus haloalkaliphilus]